MAVWLPCARSMSMMQLFLLEKMPESPANLDGIGKAWYRNAEIRDRILEIKGFLVLPDFGAVAPTQTFSCCVLNQDFLIPIMKAMRAAKTLTTPSVGHIYPQMVELWKMHELSKRKKFDPRRRGRYPQIDETWEPDDETSGFCHADAKGIKHLLCFVRKQFLSTRVAKETWQHAGPRMLHHETCVCDMRLHGTMPKDLAFRKLVVRFGQKACAAWVRLGYVSSILTPSSHSEPCRTNTSCRLTVLHLLTTGSVKALLQAHQPRQAQRHQVHAQSPQLPSLHPVAHQNNTFSTWKMTKTPPETRRS